VTVISVVDVGGGEYVPVRVGGACGKTHLSVGVPVAATDAVDDWHA